MFSQRNNPYCDLLQFRYYKYSRYNSYQEDFLYLFSIFEKMVRQEVVQVIVQHDV